MWLSAKETACKTGHVGLILESEDPLEKEMPIPSSIFVWELPWCRSCLYIFEINSLSVASFAIIFSHSEGFLFTLLIVSFVVQKLLILIRSHLFILLLFPIFWEVDHRGSCCDVCQRVFCLCSPLGVL